MKTGKQFLPVLAVVILLFGRTLMSADNLAGFEISPYFDEQVATFSLPYEVRIRINAPSAQDFKTDKPVGLVLFALPNGNSIEQTEGKLLREGDDWHFDIQHIAAQTRFLRQKVDYNLVTVYLEAAQKSWPAWKKAHPDDHDILIRQTVEYLRSLFSGYQPFVILNGHSGGGRFIFSFLDASAEIPDYIRRICFLDSDYGYESFYGQKISRWLDGAPDRCLTVLAYNDSVALYNGKPVVSATGGTWYRSKMMLKDLSASYLFKTTRNDSVISHTALAGRIKIFLVKNPERKILHTVQVERNGFIHSILTATPDEQEDYVYYSSRCYNNFIQQDEIPVPNINIPLRSPLAKGGLEIMKQLEDLSFEEREQALLQEFLSGNVPGFLRRLKTIKEQFYDADSLAHAVEYRVFPDYLAVGSDSDYCRIPLGPHTAQKIADFYNASLPTRKLVNHIYINAEVKLEPVTYYPVADNNEQIYMFVRHSVAIDSQLQAAGAHPGQLVGGIKKDVLLTNKIMDPDRSHHVTIYGWHRLTGVRIQPLTNIHNDRYVDYSHGIRLVDKKIKIDDTFYDINSVLKDSLLYRLLSDETGPMIHTSYIK